MNLLLKAFKRLLRYFNPRLYLKIVFRFQNWHLAPYSNKKYCHLIIEELNLKKKK